jgi:hypothetical protein
MKTTFEWAGRVMRVGARKASSPLIGLSAGLIALSCGGTTSADGTSGGAQPAPSVSPTSTAAVSSDTGGRLPNVVAQGVQLCDGSQAVRLSYSSALGGGPLPASAAFTEKWGFNFLTVTGTCQYWAGFTAFRGFVSGTLTDAQAKDLSVAMSFGRFGEFSEFTGDYCVDGNTRYLRDPSGKMQCNCDCSGGPSAYQEAFAQASGWARSLYEMGEPLTGGIWIALEEVSPGELVNSPLEWPLPWKISARPEALATVGNGSFSADTGLFVEDPTEVDALREVRRAVLAQQGDLGATVTDGEGAYRLYLRDDLPALSAEALEQLWR